jgi:hypothetical protein
MCAAAEMPHNSYRVMYAYALFAPLKQAFTSFHLFDSFAVYTDSLPAPHSDKARSSVTNTDSTSTNTSTTSSSSTSTSTNLNVGANATTSTSTSKAKLSRKSGGLAVSIVDLLTVYSAVTRENASAAIAALSSPAPFRAAHDTSPMNVTEWALPILISEHGLATDVPGLSDIFDVGTLQARQLDSHWSQIMTLIPHSDVLLG